MIKLNERGQAFERHFQAQQEMHFHAETGAMKSVAFWAADVLGLSKVMADDYVNDVLTAYLSGAGHVSAIEKIIADCEQKGKTVSSRSLMTLLTMEKEKFMALCKDEDASEDEGAAVVAA